VNAPPGLAEIAAARLARLPWRRLPPPEGAPPPRQRGWIGGLDEAATLLEELTGITPRRGGGLGGNLPWVPAGGAVIGCGLPLAVGPKEVQGPDGTYRLADATVLREAGGRTEELLHLEDPPPARGALGFDLLWFGTAERYLVRRGRVEIEDLFARVVGPVDRTWLERTLLRRQRVDPAFLHGVEVAPSRGAATVEVRRAADLTGPGWDDPQRLIGARESVENVKSEGEWLRVRLKGGEEIQAAVSTVSGGWVAHFEGEALAWRRLWARRDEGSIVYGAEPVADPRDPGVRTRWAFDLMTDLLELERS